MGCVVDCVRLRTGMGGDGTGWGGGEGGGFMHVDGVWDAGGWGDVITPLSPFVEKRDLGLGSRRLR